MGRNIVWSSTRIHFGNFIFWKFMYDLFAILKEINFAVAMLWQYTFYIWSYSWKYSKLCSPSTFKLFSNSQMNVILENCHLSINVNRPSTIKIGEHITSNSYYEKLLNVKVIAQFSFSNHLEKIIKNSQNVLYAYFK